MKRFFTADFHLGSERVLQTSSRPFSTVEEMDNALIDACNSICSEEDVLYHIGDLFCFGSDGDFTGSQIRWPEVKKRFVPDILPLSGNHDENNGVKTIASSLRLTLGRRFKCVLCHYPSYDPRSSESLIPGDINICGHVHSFWPHKRFFIDKTRKILNINVGVDVWDYKPISEVTLVNYITHLMAELSREHKSNLYYE